MPLSLTALAAQGRIAPDWAEALAPVATEIAEIGGFLDAERAAGRDWLPAEADVFRAFAAPLADVRVLIVGQDPYPTPGHPIGVAFGCDREVRPLPRSLGNISRELVDDLGVAPLSHGDLSAWSARGVLLLNRVLTVRSGAAGSHAGIGWERVTDRAIAALVARGGPLVSILWGKQAEQLAPALAGTAVLTSAHPSPLSARRGFFGSRPFSRTNELLLAQGATPLDWSVPADAPGELPGLW
ncbi:uracil-DNA glycosylase [Leucobacter sp. M11]|uniref:uracil-DNA glycosylase n=1 Tax=Leucobacter sp. M11 TaxID=2993565 RepID=UPI002D8025F4|nr:uracil-DNA glycosylase [Leucobacter sp. M11]MEB4614166.1 uracil-DNA glycosylase [Leucobacter sp. M11]